jgi:hypothetical protein
MGVSNPISGRKLREAVRNSVRTTNQNADVINNQGRALLNLHRRVELVEAVAQGGLFARLLWILRGVPAEKPAVRVAE